MPVTATSRQGTENGAVATEITVRMGYESAAYILGFIRQVQNGATPLRLNLYHADKLHDALVSAGVAPQ